LIEKEEKEETRKEKFLMTPLAGIIEKESLNVDCNTLNSSFQLHNASYSLQKYKKKTFCDVVA